MDNGIYSYCMNVAIIVQKRKENECGETDTTSDE